MPYVTLNLELDTAHFFLEFLQSRASERHIKFTNYYFLCVFVQIANSNPLVSERQDLSVLQREYADEDTVYQLKIKVCQTSPPALTHIRVLLLCSVVCRFCCLRAQEHFEHANLQHGM